jgi:hydrogenase/urease accessory protein HupE
MQIRLPLTLILVLSLCGAALSHPSGTSRIAIRIHPGDSVAIEINVNATDAINALNKNFTPFQPPPRDTILQYQDQVAAYLYTHLNVSANSRSFLKTVPVAWDKSGKSGNHPWDSATLFDANHVVTFSGKLPASSVTSGRRLLRVNTQLFPEFEVQTLSEISVFWRDSLIDRKWIGLDKTYALDVSTDSLDARFARLHEPSREAGSPFLRFIKLGYVHILPYGLDHILFVLGLFFFSTRLRPLFLQVTAFTIAHSITLGLALLGLFSLRASIVEPLIALSIAVVGLENVFFRQVRASRWLVVFAFGLIHGLGFASVLKDFGFPPGGFWQALLGFNVGVELGQISVITAAFAATFAFRNKPWYFPRVVVPVSLAISAFGLYWAFERIWGA